jgi:dolichyl-diphosphooligosaccharide--protein glycosyltransferase
MVFAGVGLAAFILVPAWNYYEPRFQSNQSTRPNARRAAARSAARWLASSRPQSLDENGHPTAGLLCEWGLAHEVRYYSGWAVHQDGFGPYVSPENITRAERYFRALDEDQAIEILKEMRTRYVLADVWGAGNAPYFYRSMTIRLGRLHGSGELLKVGETNQRDWVPALTRHRLVFAANDGRKGLWLYEIVPGAIVVGSATPGSLVSARLSLQSSSGRVLEWVTHEHADETGAFRLRLPYSTAGMPESSIVPLGSYHLHTDRGVAEFEVTEASVQDGIAIQAPAVRG